VPYRGGAPAMQDLMAGRVDLMFDQAANAITQVRAGTIKAYAVMTKERWHLAPDIPTIDESGVAGLHISYWHALFAPKGTAANIIAKVNAAVLAALADPTVQQRFAAQGQDIWPPDQDLVEFERVAERSGDDKPRCGSRAVVRGPYAFACGHQRQAGLRVGRDGP
jgi:tripartite-type tricarboxylate transporter receptor subunit TctC